MTLPAWGNPWRGLLLGGQIQLPNGSTEAATQPTVINARHWDERGATFLQRGPLAGVSRSTEELEADTAAGRTWRADAILSGQRMRLYNKNLAGWIYCAPDGVRWRVPTSTIMVPITTSAPLSLTVTLRKFGEFSGAGATQVVSLALTDLQQADPDPTYPAGTEAYLTVCDISPDGSKALLMIYQPLTPFSASSPVWHPMHKRALGWLEVSLTSEDGVVSATVTVARSRAQTMGTSSFIDGSLALVERSAPPNQLARVDMGEYYQDTYTVRPLAEGGASLYWSEGVGAYERVISGRLVALWYTAAGGMEEVAIDVSATGTASNPAPTEVASGSLVQHVQKSDGAVTVISDDREHYLARTSVANEEFSYTLKRGGTIIDQVTGVASTSIQQTRFVGVAFGLEATENDSVTVDGVTNTRSLALPSTITSSLYSAAPQWLAWVSIGSSSAESFYRAADIGLTFPNLTIVTLTPLRYSNNLIAVRRDRLEGAVHSYTHGPAAFPGGSDPSSTAASLNAVYGSYNPATGEVVRDSTQPVCWI